MLRRDSERTGRRTRLRSRLASTVAVVMMATTVAAGAQTNELRAAEGDWSGFVAFRGTTPRGVTQSARGSFEFTSVAGEVDGTFQWSSGEVTIGGVVGGSDAAPRFDLTSVVFQGTSIPDVSGGGEIRFTAATCERLEGEAVNIDVERMGVQIDEVVWWAIRRGASGDAGAFFESLQALREEVSDLLESLRAGRIDVGGVFGRVEPALVGAERLAAQLDRTEGCGSGFYRSVIASEIELLALYVLENPDLDAFQIGQLLITAARAGVIGSGTESEPGVLEVELKGLLADRVAAAIAAEDTTELVLLGALAEELGWDDIAEQAALAMQRLGE